jgi:NCK-associated protein 1
MFTFKVNEMASAAGFSSKLDSLLIQCIQSMPKQDAEDEYLVSCLLMVFVAVSIPKLARSDSSQYKVSFGV